MAELYFIYLFIYLFIIKITKEIKQNANKIDPCITLSTRTEFPYTRCAGHYI